MLIALLVCLIPTTIGALLSAIGIAGMDRLVQRNVLAMSGRAVEAAGDVTTLLLDKTGTITLRQPPRERVRADARRRRSTELERGRGARSLADPTPEGISIVDLAAERGIRVRAAPARRGRAVHRADPHVGPRPAPTARRPQGRRLGGHRLGRGERPDRRPACTRSSTSASTRSRVSGGTPLVVARRRPPTARRTRARRRPPEGHRQGRPRDRFARAARDGHPHRDDHGRQPAHREGDRRRGGRRRLPRRGHARGQARAHPAASRRAATSSR